MARGVDGYVAGYTILHLPDQRQMLVTYHADPGSRSEEGLRPLASLTSPA